MQNKLACIHPEMNKQMALKGEKSPLGSPICHWMEGKKYFAYSAVNKIFEIILNIFSKNNFEKNISEKIHSLIFSFFEKQEFIAKNLKIY